MISVSNEFKEAFLSAAQKNLILIFDDETELDNNEISFESMSLEQSLCDTDELKFGKVSSACFKVKIKYSEKRYKNLWFDAKISIKTHEIQLGRFKVYTDNMTSDQIYREIVAYDALFWAINTDITEWYNALIFPITQKMFRNSLFNHLGIEQETISLMNDNISFKKTINSEKITGLEALEALCEINATFGVMNNKGNFRYAQIQTTDPKILSKADYYQGTFTYNEYNTKPISKVTIREDTDDLGYSYGENGNTYIIENNFLLYGASDSTLQTVSKKIYDYISQITYTPASVSCKGAVWVETGDLLTIISDKKTVIMPILNRQLSGITALKDVYTARGSETYSEVVNGTKNKVKKLQSRMNQFSRTLDETKSEISKVEIETKKYIDDKAETIENNTNASTDEKLKSYSTITQMNTAIKQTANSLSSTINEQIGETKEYIDGEILTTNINLVNKIEQTSSSLKSEISKTYVTNAAIEETVNNLQQQIDGAVETFSGSTVPTLTNVPAVNWTTNTIKDTHVGDLYIVNSDGGDYAGFYYRFEKTGNTYQWTLLKDNEITKALQDSKEANEKALEVAKNLAENYITETEVKSAITQNAENLNSSISKTYSTKAELSTAKIELENNANVYAENKANAALENAKVYTDSVKVGGRNLYIVSNSSKGFLQEGVISLGAMNSVYNEYTSEYIPITTGEEYVFQNWVTVPPNISSSYIWYAYQFYTSNKGLCGSRYVTRGGEILPNGKTYGKYHITVPKEAAYLRVSARFYADGQIKLEKGNKATDWTPAPEDVEADATTKANNALASAKADTDTKLLSYSTTSEMNSAIDQKANSITSTVNEKITETKKYADTVGDNTLLNANKNTTNLLKSYSTTSEMNSAIDQKANSITSTVSKTYATKTDVSDLKLGNLIKNGYGEYFNNTNFGGATFTRNDGTCPNGCYGFFNGGGWTEHIPYDLNIQYDLEYYCRLHSGKAGNNYFSIVPYDVDGHIISPSHAATTTMTNKLFYLAKDLKEGDTVVYFKDLADWKVPTSATYQRSFLFYGYRDSTGYTYPDGTYSRYYYENVYISDSSVDKTNKTITLKSAWTGATFKAGTCVRHASSGGTYCYYGQIGACTNTAWKKYTVSIKSGDDRRFLYAKTIRIYLYNNIADYCGLYLAQKTIDDTARANITTLTTKVTSVETLATQTATKFNWLVKSGTSSSDFTITDRLASLTAKYINLNGLVTFSGLDATLTNTINTASNTANNALSVANTAKTNAATAQSTANAAQTTANAAQTAAANVLSTAVQRFKYVVDLSNTTTYNADTYYPVTGTVLPGDGYRTLSISVHLNSGTKPSWSTHTNGFTCDLTIRVKSYGWGTATDNMGWIDDASYKYCNKMPAYFQQMTNSSTPVFYLRGGGKYYLYADYSSTWTPRTSTYTVSSQSIAPTTTPSNWSYLGNSWKIESAIANWCYENNVSYINGSKIYAGTIGAKQINVDDLFSQNIVATGYIRNITSTSTLELNMGTASILSKDYQKTMFTGGKNVSMSAYYPQVLWEAVSNFSTTEIATVEIKRGALTLCGTQYDPIGIVHDKIRKLAVTNTGIYSPKVTTDTLACVGELEATTVKTGTLLGGTGSIMGLFTALSIKTLSGANLDSLVGMVKVVTANYPADGSATLFSDNSNYLIRYTCPTGYTPIMVRVNTESFTGNVNCSSYSSTTVIVWTSNNCEGAHGYLKAEILCIRSELVG